MPFGARRRWWDETRSCEQLVGAAGRLRAHPSVSGLLRGPCPLKSL